VGNRANAWLKAQERSKMLFFITEQLASFRLNFKDAGISKRRGLPEKDF
jgi:hypothetical protein